MKISFEKTYTRDTTLILQQLWFQAMRSGIEKNLQRKNPFSIVGIDYVNDGTIEVWQNKEAIRWIKDCFVCSEKGNPPFILHQLQKYQQQLPLFYERCSSLGLLDLIAEIDHLMFGDLLLSFLAGEKRISGKVKELALKLRAEDHFFARCDVAIRQALSKTYAGFGDKAIYLLLSEILSGKFPSKEDLQQRFHYFVVCSDGQCSIETLETFAKKKQDSLFIQDDLPNDDVVKGKSAYLGKATGTVKILRKRSDLKKIQEGDIIVSPMTTPLFIPVLKKASAIVTDEGGIACHAAIVARELKKPCVVATKIATKVFKDGDLVEVDADKGIVRKIT